MEKNSVEQFLMFTPDFFEPNRAGEIIEKLKSLPDDQSIRAMSLIGEFKKPTTTLLFAALLGGVGADRFYLGKIGTGVLKLVLAIISIVFFIFIIPGLIFGVWWIVDIALSKKNAQKYNTQKFFSIFNDTTGNEKANSIPTSEDLNQIPKIEE